MSTNEEKIFSVIPEALHEYITPTWVQRMHDYFSEDSVDELAEQVVAWINDAFA